MLMKLEADLVFISLSNSLSSNNVYGESLFRVVLYANKNIFLFLSKCVLLSVFCNIRNLFFLTLMGMMIPGSDLIMTFKGSSLSVILGYCRISLTCGKIGLTLIHEIEYLLFRFSSSPAY